MKKLIERLRADSDRTKLLISVCAVGCVIVAAMLLPLAFRSAPGDTPNESGASLERRTQMFADYWLRGAEESGFSVEKPDPVPRKMKETCETVMRTLIARCVDDQGLTAPAPTGSEYTVVSDGAGGELTLCRMWMERRGDWQNWLDVCMDAETGEIYYLYLSRECLTNRRNYPPPEPTDAVQIAEQMASETGWTLRYASAEDGGGAAVFSSAGGTLCYEISCRIYDALIDVRISCR